MYRSRFFFRSLWLSKKKVLLKAFSRVLTISIVFSIIYFTYFWVDLKMLPSIKSVSSSRAQSIATDAINEVIFEQFSRSGEVSQFAYIEKDGVGNISSINANTLEINRISAKIARSIVKKFEDMGSQTINIPIGTLINCDSFSGYGPYIKIRILPAGSVKTDFKSEITQAGINQSRYRLYIDINCEVRVAAPLISENIQVCTSMPIVDTVIVGKVPDTYVGLNGDL